MLKQRILAALVMIPIVIVALFMLPLQLFALFTLIICLLACWEWAQFVGYKAKNQRVIFTLGCAVLLIGMLWPYFSNNLLASPYLIFSPLVVISLWLALGWWILATLLVLSYPRSAKFWQNSSLIKLLFGIFTIVPFFWGMMILRQYNYATNSYLGAWWLLYVMVLVWGADSGAYAFGRLWGKHKLAPKVSPGKTVEGLLGGLFTAAIIAWLFNLFTPLALTLSSLLVCSIIAVLASVLGDLTESMFKREAGIKDSGNLIPGHGGILDRIDSLTAAIPVFACLAMLVF